MFSLQFKIDVCMANVNPLVATDKYYTDYTKMLDDFKDELNACYSAKDTFMDTWSALCVDVGIDLPSLARNRESIMLGMYDMDTENAVVTDESDNSHRITSQMIFYSALGFVTLAAFAVFGTAVVVRVLNKRQEDRDTKASLGFPDDLNRDHQPRESSR